MNYLENKYDCSNHYNDENLVPLKNLQGVFPDKGISDNVNDIFKNMNLQDLGVCSLVNKRWNLIVNHPYFSKEAVFNKFAFNPADWNRFFGEGTVAEAENEKAFKLLPNHIIEFLKSSSLAFLGKRIMDTHILVWIPETIKGDPLTINSFGELLKIKLEIFNNKGSHSHFLDAILRQGDYESAKSGWVLMATDVLPDSRYKSCADQWDRVKDLNVNGQSGWRFPKFEEATICIVAFYLSSGKHLFSDNPLTFTRCQEIISDCPVAVGVFALSGINFSISAVSRSVGVASLLEVS